MTSEWEEFPVELIRSLREAQRVVVLTGAGISAESGVPTFRDAQTGLWAKYDPQELATPEAFHRNPRLVWEWYEWRRDLIAGVKPNSGHDALAALENLVPSFTLITQNIDSLHQKAGSKNVIELHGNLSRYKCSVENRIVDNWATTNEIPPSCPHCGSLLRPDVVWFGESLPVNALNTAMQASQSADFFMTIGTSGIVQPAASLPIEAVLHGATVIEINPNVTPISGWMTFILRGPSGSILPALVETAWPSTK